MRAGGRKDYRDKRKAHWRNTVWNNVLQRTKGREKSEVILYLAGPEDIDRSIAVSKGVPNENLIAIDREKINGRSVRSAKGIAIIADVFEVLWSWPKNRPVCAVMLDLCCGLTDDVLMAYDVFEQEPFRRAVGCFNLMRGRDGDTTKERRMLVDDFGFDGSPFVDTPLHRGAQMLMLHAWMYWTMLQERDEPNYNHNRRYALPDECEREEGLLEVQSLVTKGMRPSFFSYRSGVLVFDSVVFEHPSRILHGVNLEAYRCFQPAHMRQYDEIVRGYVASLKVPATSRKISAALAVRTMRSSA